MSGFATAVDGVGSGRRVANGWPVNRSMGKVLAAVGFAEHSGCTNRDWQSATAGGIANTVLGLVA
jgi:hypothetical protein